jgi:hypothetical protein
MRGSIAACGAAHPHAKGRLMTKLKLNLENLAVESFGTEREPRAKGTVEAHALISLPHPSCYSRTECSDCSCDGHACR